MIEFTLDRSSCSGSLHLRMYIDGNDRGLHDLAPGGGATFASGEGYHRLEVREEGGSNRRWATGQVFVPKAGYNLILLC